MAYAHTLEIKVTKWEREPWPGSMPRTEYGLLTNGSTVTPSEIAMLKTRLENDWGRYTGVKTIEITVMRSVHIDFDVRGLFVD